MPGEGYGSGATQSAQGVYVSGNCKEYVRAERSTQVCLPLGKGAAQRGGNLRRLTFAAIAVAILALIGLGTYRWGWRSQAIDSLAVLPFLE